MGREAQNENGKAKGSQACHMSCSHIHGSPTVKGWLQREGWREREGERERERGREGETKREGCREREGERDREREGEHAQFSDCRAAKLQICSSVAIHLGIACMAKNKGKSSKRSKASVSDRVGACNGSGQDS